MTLRVFDACLAIHLNQTNEQANRPKQHFNLPLDSCEDLSRKRQYECRQAEADVHARIGRLAGSLGGQIQWEVLEGTS